MILQSLKFECDIKKKRKRQQDDKMDTHAETLGASRKWTGSIRMLANVSVRASPLKGVVAYFGYGNKPTEISQTEGESK